MDLNLLPGLGNMIAQVDATVSWLEQKACVGEKLGMNYAQTLLEHEMAIFLSDLHGYVRKADQ